MTAAHQILTTAMYVFVAGLGLTVGCVLLKDIVDRWRKKQ